MKRYRVILADPAWLFGDKQANRPANYHRMNLREVRALDVRSIAADNAMLFLWCTATHTPVVPLLMHGWGFEFKTLAFVWEKLAQDGENLRLGMGHYTRQQAELCWLGVRGSPEVASHSVRQVVRAPWHGHSAKPPEVRDRIVELAGDVSRVELFARGVIPEGWDAWGDEAANPTEGIEL